MSGQYFENNDNLKSDIHKFSYYYKGKEIFFFSDNGVFSKNKIDFGSNLLLKSLKINEGDNILDVGCGYGTIGVTVALMNPKSKVTMIDVNERAIKLTKMAIEANNIQNAQCFISNMYEKIDCQFNLIITNPPIRAGKIIVHSILKDALDHLKEDGRIIAVIQKKQGAPSAIKMMEECYKKVSIINSDKGYLIIEGLK